ncbi:hypothetical protein B9Y60_00840 [Stenotrophomonas maltophilia]|nr:hypothetical protein B9Y73_00840 [Stenotrophomonas maltophilia]PJL62215.1 hypothetical protein B9Y60_00840 [Stenotrophomonas maltophilia]
MRGFMAEHECQRVQRSFTSSNEPIATYTDDSGPGAVVPSLCRTGGKQFDSLQRSILGGYVQANHEFG